MASCASGTNVSHLSRTHIEGYEFVLPEEKLLVLFNDFIQPLFNKQALIEDENQKLVQTRNRLLAKLI
jgi:type I restriction enzyme S subunit